MVYKPFSTPFYILDDGHGMKTSGKRTDKFTDGTKSKETGQNFMHENEFNRAVVKYLGQHLVASGIKVGYSAPTDADTPLEARVAYAEKMGATALVSVHANALTGKFATGGRGIETFVWMTGGAAGASEKLGRAIHKELIKGTKLVDRGIKKGNHLFLLRKTTMPSVLVECGFMDNLTEAKLLMSDAYRRECAEEIARGICAYEKVAFKGKAVVADSSTPPAKSNINTEKGIGTVVIDAKVLPMREKPDGNAKLIRNLSAGELYYVYAVDGAWYNLGPGWVYDLNRKSLTYSAHPKQLYRVRKTWGDIGSQVGAFYDLAGAKEAANEKGLTVFDEKGKSVYVGKKPEAPLQAPEEKPAQESKKHPIEGVSEATVYQMLDFLEIRNPNFKDAKAVAAAFLSVGGKYGIRGDIAFCQSVIETSWFKFDGGTAVTPDQHNYCGMGVTSKGMKGNSFGSIEDGVTAQIQHLFAYANNRPMPTDKILDPRFKYVTRGSAPNWEDLSMKWAMNENYGKHILELYQELMKMELNQEEVSIEELLSEFPEWARVDARVAIEASITDGSRPNDTMKRVDGIVMFGRLIQMLKKQ